VKALAGKALALRGVGQIDVTNVLVTVGTGVSASGLVFSVG
jgi:hypothetical protein